MQLNQLIDQTWLKPTATREEIIKLCREAKQYQFWSVCVNPVWVKLAKQQGVRACTVIGFPLGSNTTEVKIAESIKALEDKADELDMVINLGWLKDRKNRLIKNEIGLIKKTAGNRIVKVIIETAYLTKEEKVLAAKLAKVSGADFVKTSTGFGPGGATVEDVKLLRGVVGPGFGVKASGGIKTRVQAEALVKAGANRIGSSSGVEICG